VTRIEEKTQVSRTKCSKCGNVCAGSHKFCQKCGAALRQESVAGKKDRGPFHKLLSIFNGSGK
jgi:uncharacterized OB-fold protein